MSSSATHLDPVIMPLIRGKTVLDVGCGCGRFGFLIKSNFWEAGLKEPPKVDGIDAFKPNVKFCSKLGVYDKVRHKTLPSSLKGKWDTVLACEVLEHIERKHVLDVLDNLEKIANKRIIISTPNWPFYTADGSDTFLGFNGFNTHKSYLSRKLLRKRGYTLLGSGFGNPSNSFYRLLRKIDYKLGSMLQSIPRKFPLFGESIIAYKDFNLRYWITH